MNDRPDGLHPPSPVGQSAAAAPALGPGDPPKPISAYGEIFLPTGRMLQIDRVVELDDERIVCETDLPDNWVFEFHFPGDPIFPGSLMVEGAGQAIAIWAWERGMRGDPRLVRVAAEFRCPVCPQDRVITYTARIRSRRNLCLGRVEVSAAGRPVALIEESLLVTNGRNGGPAATPRDPA